MKRIVFLCVAVCSSFLMAELLPQGRFVGEGIANGWWRDAPDDHQGTMKVVEVDGRQAQLIHWTGRGKVGIYRTSTDIRGIRPNANYLLEGWVKADSEWAVFWYEFLKNREYLTHVPGRDAKTDWRKLSLKIKTTDDCSYFRISLIARNPGEPIYFSDFSLRCLDDTPEVRVPLLKEAPVQDADWAKAVQLSPFVTLGKDLKLPDVTTQASVAYHNQKLYFKILCHEPELDKLKLNQKSFWDNDTIELFLTTNQGTFHFGIAPDGKSLQRKILPDTARFFKNWHAWDFIREADENLKTLDWIASATRQPENNAWIAHATIDIPKQIIPKNKVCKLQLGRSRKIGDTQQNSAWCRTNGEFFLEEGANGLLWLPHEPDDVKPQEIMPKSLLEQLREKFVVPAPQRQATGNKAIVWTGSPKVFFDASCQKSFLVLCRVFNHQFGIEPQKVGKPEQADIILTMGDVAQDLNLAPWQRHEAYELVAEKQAILKANTTRGLACAIQTMRQLCVRYDDQIAMMQNDILDWPNMQFRGWQLFAPDTQQFMDDAFKVIDTLAALKFNWIAIQIDDRMVYEKHPKLARENAPTKSQHREIADLIDLYDINPLPMTQCMSHFDFILNKPEFRHFAEIQDPDLKARWKFWNYCPRHPDIHKLMFDMIEEQLQCYPKAKLYNVALDEITFEPIGVCDRCKGASGGELLAEEINILHEFLKSKGISMAMWGDQLLVEHNGGEPYNTAQALPKIPKDVIIFDWHYNIGNSHKSVKFFQDNGFQLVGNGWYWPANITTFIDEIKRLNCLGFSGTTWKPIEFIRNSHHLMTAIVLAAERTWAFDKMPIEKINYHTNNVFRSLHDPYQPGQPSKFLTYDLSNWFNVSLRGGGNNPWMGLSSEHGAEAILSAGPLQWFSLIPFKLETKGNLAAIELKDDVNAIRQIPINSKAASLSFLHTASVSKVASPLMHGDHSKDPQKLGYYIVHFDDGSHEIIDLYWNKTISAWNSQVGATVANVAWSGHTQSGARVMFDVLTWRNPHPEKPIASFDFVREFDSSYPVLLAVTAEIF